MKVGVRKAKEDPAFFADISGKRKEKTKKLSPREKMRIQEQAENTRRKLTDLIEKLLYRQIEKAEKNRLIEVNARGASYKEFSVADAQAAISEDGAFGVKAVSERIVSFAIAISGGDSSKLAELKKAIDKGFEQAEKSFGGTLPDICSETYDEIMRKLDEWAGIKSAAPNGTAL
jgi:predicted KAP-like P-loop ATPase